MRAGELCVRDVVTVGPEESVVAAARRMADMHVGDLIVVDSRAHGLPAPIGIVTDRDLVIEVLARERVAATTRIAEVMRRDLVLGSEDEDIETIATKMREHAIRRIPIVDRRGGLQGMLSVDDVIGWLRDQIQTATKLLERQGTGPQLHMKVAR
ncbi:MAG: CBS domain-containing protein [Acidobacteriota bacterium]